MTSSSLGPHSRGTCWISPGGSLVAATVDPIRRQVQEALEEACTEVVLDLGLVDAVDSVGITLILGLYKTCLGRGASFRVEGARADMLRTFRLLSLDRFFPIGERQP